MKRDQPGKISATHTITPYGRKEPQNSAYIIMGVFLVQQLTGLIGQRATERAVSVCMYVCVCKCCQPLARGIHTHTLSSFISPLFILNPPLFSHALRPHFFYIIITARQVNAVCGVSADGITNWGIPRVPIRVR